MAIKEMSQMDALKLHMETTLLALFGEKLFNESKSCAKNHPFLFLAFSLVSLFSAIPVVIFLGFAAVTLVIAVLCFIFIEGSIIVVGGIVLIGVISFISIITLGMVSGVAVGYWLLCKSRIFLGCVNNARAISAVSSTGNQENDSVEKVD